MRNRQLRGYLEGFWGTWLVHVGRQLGLFEALKAGPLTGEALAEQRGFEPVYTEVWCRAASAYELLTYDPERGYQLAEGWGDELDTTGAWATTYIQVSQRVHETLGAVFSGKAFPEPSLSLRTLMSDGLRYSYSWLWTEFAPRVPQLHERLDRGRRLIEFGCGCGYGLEQLRSLYPELELTGIEQDFDCAREAERATRAVIVVGTAEECRYDSRFDVAVFHRSLSQCVDPRKALRQAAEALRPEGLLVVTSESELDADPSAGSGPRLRLGERFFFQMFMAPDALRSLSMAQIEAWCREDGLQTVSLERNPDRGSPTLVCCKPD